MSWHSLVLRRQLLRGKFPHQGGFGLVELMVSISVMVLVASVILVKQGTFNGAVLLRSQAYEIALALRETQLTAISASGDVGTFRAVYGIYFDSSAANNGYYQAFRDLDADGFYDAGEEIGQRNALDTRFEIKAVRSVGEVMTGSELTVVFVRPNFDARFYDTVGELLSASRIEIDIAKRDTAGVSCFAGERRTIEVTRTGQIAVNDC